MYAKSPSPYHRGVQPSAALKAAVVRADDVFEKKLARPATLCMHCDSGGRHSPDRLRLDAILLAHRAHRLTVPVAALDHLQLGHGSAMVHQSLRRFAWFVPPLLAVTLEPDSFVAGLSRLGELAEEARRDDASFTAAEVECLAQFFSAALASITEDGPVDELAAILAACGACGTETSELVAQWLAGCARSPGGWAERRLLSAIDGPSNRRVERALGTLAVRAYLESRALAEGDPALLVALSSAEAAVAEWAAQ
jgi:hypothetical protein